MVAWLQRNIERGAVGVFTGLFKGDNLGMGSPGSLMKALSGNIAVLDNNGTYQGIGGRPATTPFGQLKGHFHESLVHDYQRSQQSKKSIVILGLTSFSGRVKQFLELKHKILYVLELAVH